MIDLSSICSEVEFPTTKSADFKFGIDTDARPDFLRQKIDHRNKLAGRLERLINEPTVGGHPFITYMFKNVPDATPEELLNISKALARIAELMEPFQKIDAEVKGLTWVKENHHLVACAYGDFTAPDNAEFFASLEES